MFHLVSSNGATQFQKAVGRALPHLTSLFDLSMAVGISEKQLRNIITQKKNHYRTIRLHKPVRSRTKSRKNALPKSDYPGPRSPFIKTKFRILHVPSDVLKCVQTWILHHILYVPVVSPCATAYVPGRSINDNVKPHKEKKYFLCMDIRNFFDSITFEKVASLFEALNYTPEVARLLAEMTTFRGVLPQGSPSSPVISNLIMKPIDDVLACIACDLSGLSWNPQRGVLMNIVPPVIKYTRYADDITFSSMFKPLLLELVPIVDSLLGAHGFAVNWDKYHIVGPRRRCVVTGLVKNCSSHQFGIGRALKRRMRSIILAAAQYIFEDDQYQTMAAIDGWLSYLNSVDRASYEQMFAYYKRIGSRYENPHMSDKRIIPGSYVLDTRIYPWGRLDLAAENCAVLDEI